MYIYIYVYTSFQPTKSNSWLLFAYVLVKEQRDYENRLNIIFTVECQGRKLSTWKILASDFGIPWRFALVSREFVFIRSRSWVLTFMCFLFPVLLLLFFIWRICKNDWKSFSYDPRGTYFQSKNMRDSKRSRQLLNCSKYLPVACVGCKAILFQRRTLNIIIIIAFNPRNTEIKTVKPMWYHINVWAN